MDLLSLLVGVLIGVFVMTAWNFIFMAEVDRFVDWASKRITKAISAYAKGKPPDAA